MKKILRNIILGVVTVVGAVSCVDLDELNRNPCKASTIDPNLLLPYVQQFEGTLMRNWSIMYIYPGSWCNHFSGYQGMTNYGAKGVFFETYSSRMWTEWYPKSVKNVVALVNLADDDSNIYQVGRIMRSEIMLKMTDAYGDIPYFDAGNTVNTGRYKCVYDSQETIYNDILKELKEASEALDPSKDALTSDLYFKGDLAKWKKYANSLSLRMAMRMIKVNPTLARSTAEDAVASGVMTELSDMVAVRYNDDRNQSYSGNGNANFFDFYDEKLNITTELIEAMGANTSNPDPRFAALRAIYYVDGTEVKDEITDQVYSQLGQWYGLPAQVVQEGNHKDGANDNLRCEYPTQYALAVPLVTITLDGNKIILGTQEGDVDTVSGLATEHPEPHKCKMVQLHRDMYKADNPYVKMSLAEVLLYQAEGKFRGWNTGAESAEQLYQKGIAAACRTIASYNEATAAKFTDAAIDAYASGCTLTTGDELELINTQIWLDFIFNPLECWANIRRTDGMPTQYAGFKNWWPQLNQTGGKMPRRLAYPTTEQQKNGENMQVAVDKLPVNPVDGKRNSWLNRVWWDVE